MENPYGPNEWRIGQDTGCIIPPPWPLADLGMAGRWLAIAAACEMLADRIEDDPVLQELLDTLSDMIRELTPAPRMLARTPYSNPYMLDWEQLEVDEPNTSFLYDRFRRLTEAAEFGREDEWTRRGMPIWTSHPLEPIIGEPDELEIFNREHWRYWVWRVLKGIQLIDNQHRHGVSSTQPREIVLCALIAVAIYEHQLPLSYVDPEPDQRICVRYWPAPDALEAMIDAGKVWWDYFQEIVPFKGEPKQISGRGTTGILKKCAEPYEKTGRPWCIYKHKESDHDEALKRQPKGWPKHYKTKKDAKKALKIMERYRDE